MSIAGSPKKLAQDIAEGYLMLSPPLLKNYTSAEVVIQAFCKKRKYPL